MEIPSAQSLFQSLVVTKTSGDTPNWQPGQILKATVLSNLENGLVKLRIGNTILTAQLEAKVRVGEKLTLEVISSGEKPLLQSIRNDSLQKLVEAAIRQTLPRQQSHAQLLSHIETFIQQKQLPKLPVNVQNALKNLYQSFPDRQTISQATGVRQAFLQSGLFLEAKLSGQPPANPINPNMDIKAGLLKLQQALQQHVNTTPTAPPARNPTAINNTYTPDSIRTAPESAVSARPVTTSNFTPLGTISTKAPLTAIQNLSPSVTLSPATGSTTTTILPGATTLDSTGKTIPVTPTTTPATQAAPQRSGQGVTPGNSNTANSATTLTNSQRLMTGLSLPGVTQQNITNPLQTAISNSPYVLPAHIAFKLNVDATESRPSARFSRLDNLTKILTLFLKDAESSLARIQLNQLSQHQVEPEQKQAWLFEIPVKHKESIDLFQFKIEKDKTKNQQDSDEEKTGWTININFNTEELGQVHSKVSIHEKQVSIIFWTEQLQTTTTFQQHLQTLQHELEDAGLQVGHLNCIQGKPPEPQNTYIKKGVLDEQA